MRSAVKPSSKPSKKKAGMCHSCFLSLVKKQKTRTNSFGMMRANHAYRHHSLPSLQGSGLYQMRRHEMGRPSGLVRARHYAVWVRRHCGGCGHFLVALSGVSSMLRPQEDISDRSQMQASSKANKFAGGT